jgi:hypothetical protein
MRFLETSEATGIAKNKAYFDVSETTRDSLKRRFLVQLTIFMAVCGTRDWAGGRLA